MLSSKSVQKSWADHPVQWYSFVRIPVAACPGIILRDYPRHPVHIPSTNNKPFSPFTRRRGAATCGLCFYPVEGKKILKKDVMSAEGWKRSKIPAMIKNPTTDRSQKQPAGRGEAWNSVKKNREVSSCSFRLMDAFSPWFFIAERELIRDTPDHEIAMPWKTNERRKVSGFIFRPCQSASPVIQHGGETWTNEKHKISKIVDIRQISTILVTLLINWMVRSAQIQKKKVTCVWWYIFI